MLTGCSSQSGDSGGYSESILSWVSALGGLLSVAVSASELYQGLAEDCCMLVMRAGSMKLLLLSATCAVSLTT